MRRMLIILLAVVLSMTAGIFIIQRSAQTGTPGNSRDKIAFIMHGSRDDQSYYQTLYEAMTACCEASGYTALYHDNIQVKDFSALVRTLIADGCGIVIGTSDLYEEEMLSLSGEFPEIYFLNAAGTGSATNYASYFGRVYQARYLSGIVAGRQTKTNEIGYVSSVPVPETIRQVNAFAIGVRKVNPEATVYVRYVGSWNDGEADSETADALLDAHDIDVMTLHTNTTEPLKSADERGVFIIGNNRDNSGLFPRTFLTACVFDWEPFFTERISECMRGKFEGTHYWEGLKEGLVDIAPLTGNVSFGTGDVVMNERTRILEGRSDVFYGPVTDNYGTLRVREGENLSDYQLLNGMYWYVEGVVTE